MFNFIPFEEFKEIIESERCSDFFIGGSVDKSKKNINLIRGNLEILKVPFSFFKPSGTSSPDFNDFSIIDYGHGIKLGEYEAATHAVLYEFDQEYKNKVLKNRNKVEIFEMEKGQVWETDLGIRVIITEHYECGTHTLVGIDAKGEEHFPPLSKEVLWSFKGICSGFNLEDK